MPRQTTDPAGLPRDTAYPDDRADSEVPERAADHATDLYVAQERENRRRRFEIALERATDAQ